MSFGGPIRGAVGIALLTVLTSGDALAGGLQLPLSGARESGRAGAAVVSCDTPRCVWYNPANLAKLKGYHGLVELELLFADVGFERAPREEDGRPFEYDSISSTSEPTPIPSLMFATNAGLDDFGFAIGAFAPNAPRYEFPENGAQRYSMISTQGTALLYMNLSAAWQPLPWLRVGAGFQNAYVHIRSRLAGSAYSGLFGRPEDQDLDIQLEGEASGAWNPSGTLGLWASPMDRLEFGFSFLAPVSFEEKGELRVRLPESIYFDDVTLDPERPETTLSLNLPLILRFGGRWRADTWDLELNVVYERWSTQERIEVEPKDTVVRDVPGIGDVVVEGFTIETDMKDTVSVRLGGSYRVNPRLVVHGGYSFESAGFDDATASTFAADNLKHTLGIGGSMRWGVASIDLSYAVTINHPRDVNDSRLMQYNAVDDTQATVIGNGRYTAVFNAINLGIRLHFEDGDAPAAAAGL